MSTKDTAMDPLVALLLALAIERNTAAKVAGPKVGDKVVYKGSEGVSLLKQGMIGTLELIKGNNFMCPYYVRFEVGGISQDWAEATGELTVVGLSPLDRSEFEVVQ